MGSIPVGSTKKDRNKAVFFFGNPRRESSARAIYRAGCASFRQSRKPDEADAVFNFNKALPMIYAVTIHCVFRVFPSGLIYILY